MLSRLKKTVTRLFMTGVFYLGFLRFVDSITNNFQPAINEASRPVFPYIKKKTRNNFQILAYHRVNNENDPFFGGVGVETFKQHMEYLSENFHVLPLEDMVERARKNDIPPNAAVITFDDGYRDVYLHAYPILRAYALPATIFIATSCLEGGEVLWHDRVFAAFRATQEPYLLEYGPQATSYALRTLEEKLQAQHAVLRFLRTLDSQQRLVWIERLIARLFPGEQKTFAEMMLTWHDISLMHANGIAFGSHTVTHPILSRISQEQARWEIGESKRVIEQHLGSAVRTFAYPNGRAEDFDATTQALLQEAGYVCALTTIFGTNVPGDNLFALRRGQPWEADLPTFAAKLRWYKFCA